MIFGFGKITLSFASDFCMSQREIIPYSPFEIISTNCNGLNIKVMGSIFQNRQILFEKFESKLKVNGLQVLLKENAESPILVSQKNLKELGLKEICIGRIASTTLHIMCSDGFRTYFTTPFRESPSKLVQEYARRMNLTILQSSADQLDSFYVLGLK